MLIQFELLLCLVCLLLQFCRFFVLLCHFFFKFVFFLLPFFFLLTGPRSIYARFLASLLFSFRFFSTSECFVLLLDTRTCSFFLYVCCFDLFLLQTTCSLSLSLARSLSSTRCVSFPIWQFIGDLYSCKCYYCMFCLFPLLFYYMYMYIYLYICICIYVYVYNFYLDFAYTILFFFVSLFFPID